MLKRFLVGGLVACMSGLPVYAQNSAKSGGEVSSSAPVVFKSSTSLVQVPVVVRDGKGRAVGTLKAEDFQLFDSGKPQSISKFSVETFEGTAAPEAPAARVPAVAPASPSAPAPAAPLASDGIPSRFVAYLFDDIHIAFGDLHYVRDAVRKQVDQLARGTQRAAIYTTSGQQTLEFTSDLDRIHATLDAIGTGRGASDKALQQIGCPPMTYYEGDLIYNKEDTQALRVAISDVMQCAPNTTPDVAERMAKSAARNAVIAGEQNTGLALDAVRNIIARLASMPGQRSLVLLSPGFLVTDSHRSEQNELVERAVRSNVVIGALDARGLYTPEIYSAANKVSNPATMVAKSQMATSEAMVQADVMSFVADGTGGVFYHGTNDYDAGIARTAAPPEFLYVLGFSPTDMKFDGKFHTLKVTLRDGHGLSVQARAGYYAANKATDPAEQTRQEIQEAFFSNEERRDLGARVHTEFFKDGDEATLTVTARIDLNQLAFRKEEGRNLDNLTLVVGVFDQNGNFVNAWQKVIQMRLKEELMNTWLKNGVENATDFTVRPGRYLVRMVVRDSEGSQMAEQSTGVEIPW